MLTPLPPEGFRRTPWKNGGGVTLDIADAWRDRAVPGAWDGMLWRFGRTAIVAPGPFSDLTGYDRMQLVVAGRGLVLETPEGEIDLREPFRPVAYDGGTPIVSRLEDGPVEVVNLIADRAAFAIALRMLSAGDGVALGRGTHILYATDVALTGSVDEERVSVANGHALRLDLANRVMLALASGRGVLASVSRR